MPEYYIGLMSGTSMDGIDAVILDMTTHTLITSMVVPYPTTLVTQIAYAMRHESITWAQLGALDRLIGQAFGMAANKIMQQSKIKNIIAIGSHGQTVAHDACAVPAYTIQLGCPHEIQLATNIAVVADFRRKDIVLGGQGAPFAPVYHNYLFSQMTRPTVIVNIGGIANGTFLLNNNIFLGYDFGPGNCLLDDWTQQHLSCVYDQAGAWARQGQIIPELLENCLQDPFFAKKAPKSLGKEYFSRKWLNTKLHDSYLAVDVQATLLAFTVEVIVAEVQSMQLDMTTVLICGGGVHNLFLLESIAKRMPTILVTSTQAFGVHPDFIEAQMIAWMAYKKIKHEAIDFQLITGVSQKTNYGIYYD